MSIYKIGQNQANPNYSVDIMRIDDVLSETGTLVRTRITPALNKEIIAGDFKIDGVTSTLDFNSDGIVDPNTGSVNQLNTPHNRNTRYEHGVRAPFYDHPFDPNPGAGDGFKSKQIYSFINRNGSIGEGWASSYWIGAYHSNNAFQDPRITWAILVEVYEDVNGNLINNFPSISSSTVV